MERAYKKTIWVLPDDFLDRSAFNRALLRLDRTSSPGWPYMQKASNNGEYLGFNGIEYDPVRVEQLWIDVQWRVKNHPTWYLRLFIKQEPHKPGKVQEGRWRLILASPLDVQMLWHMLFDVQNDAEIEQAYFIPSQQGIVMPGGGWKQFYRQWCARGYDTGLDKSAWDWTVAKFLLDMDLEFRRRMCRGPKKDQWHSLAKRLYSDMFDHPLILCSDGSIYRQMYPGIMKSGCVNTISTNSHMQIMVHLMVCFDEGLNYDPLPVACGDDTLQCSYHASSVDSYARYGAIVKSASDGMEFVGHEFFPDGPRPLYLEKHLLKFCYVRDEIMPEYLDSMARMYCKDKMFDFWSAMAEELGCVLHSREYYQYWYDFDFDF